MKILVATGGDESYVELMRGLVLSLADAGVLKEVAFGVLDLGLSGKTAAWLASYRATIVTPEWDLPVNDELRNASPHLRALTARPFLPRYFPGYDIYLWMDPDTWLQQKDAFKWYIAAASTGAMAITPHLHSAYQMNQELTAWRYSRLKNYFGEHQAARLHHRLYYNIGVFGLHVSAPHWQAWARWFEAGISATGGTLVCDQTAINHALWQDRLPVHPLPALCNWICHLGVPVHNPATGLLHEPFLPHAPLGIVHMTADTKDVTIAFKDDHGRMWRRKLHYNAKPYPDGVSHD